MVDELEARLVLVELHEHRHAQRGRERGDEHRDHLGQPGTLRQQRDESGTRERDDDEGGEQRRAGHVFLDHQAPTLVRNKPTRMNAPTAMPSA